jgi:hypothetical protein
VFRQHSLKRAKKIRRAVDERSVKIEDEKRRNH